MNDQNDRAVTSRRVVGWSAALVVLAACTAVGSALVEFPPNLPQDFWGWVILFFGGTLLLLTSLAVPFLPEVANRVSGILVDFPGWLKRRWKKLRQPKRLAAGVAALVIVGGLAVVIQPAAATEPALEPGELTIMSAFDESPGDPRQILITQWNQTHPTNHVKIVDAPGEPDQQRQRMVNDVTSGGNHEADVYVLDNVWMAEFIKSTYIRPLDEKLRSTRDSDFFENVLSTCRDIYGHKPGLWGLPLNTDAGLLFYRSDLPGVERPTSWDGYFGDSAKASLAQAKRTGPQDVVGTLEAANAAQLANAEILTVTALEAIWAAGGEVVNSYGELVVNQDRSAVVFDDNAQEGLKNLAAAYEDREITLPDAESAHEDKAMAAFKDGRTLFMRNWPVAYDNLRNPSDKDAISFEVAALPGPSVLGGQNLVISKWTDKPHAAQALIEFLTSPSSQLILFEVGGFAPTRPGVYANASNISRRYAQDLRSSIERARLRPITPYYTDFSQELRIGVRRALHNNGAFEEDFPQKLAAAANGRRPR
jgi:multiple sugar transport system substrate-binding protein